MINKHTRRSKRDIFIIDFTREFDDYVELGRYIFRE